jgi:glycerate kinase
MCSFLPALGGLGLALAAFSTFALQAGMEFLSRVVACIDALPAFQGSSDI